MRRDFQLSRRNKNVLEKSLKDTNLPVLRSKSVVPHVDFVTEA
jgi:hypothetical protein